MRKLLLACTVIGFLIACNNANTESPEVKADSAAMNSDAEKTIDASKLTFVNAKDPICGMPVSAGISDTVTIDGKLYGFCAKECKDAYVAQVAERK